MTKFIADIQELPVDPMPIGVVRQLANAPRKGAPLIARKGNTVLYGTFTSPVSPRWPNLASCIHIRVEDDFIALIDTTEWDVELIDGEPLSENVVGTDALDGGELDV